MEIDLYQPCPCHAEKKIKFCCGKDVVSGLNEVLDRHGSRQTAAALDNLDRLIAQHGPKDCLLLTRSQLLLAMGRIEDAETSVRQFLERNTAHSLALERLATVLAAQQKTVAGWEALQDAMDHLPDANVPISFANGFRYVGMALLSEGCVLAARRHAHLALKLEESDPARDQLLGAVESYARALFLRRDFSIERLPDDAPETPWKKRLINAFRAQNRGQFRKSIQLIERALEVSPGEPVLLKAAVAATSTHPDPDRFVAANRAIANHPGFSQPERVEAELLAQYFERRDSARMVDMILGTLVVRDFEAVREKMLGLDRLMETDPPEVPDDREETEPPPRGAFGILDRPGLKQVTDQTGHAEIPCVQGQVLLFGRQTDREARLETLFPQTTAGTAAYEWLKQQLGGLVSDGGETVVGQREEEEERMRVAWHLPENVDRRTHERLTRERQFHVAREILPDSTFLALGGRTLREAAADPAGAVAAHALIYGLELQHDGPEWGAEWGQTIRDTIGLAPLPLLPLTDGNNLQLPQFLVRFLDLSGISTEVLYQRFKLALYLGDLRAARETARILVQRDDLVSATGGEEDAGVRVHLALAELTSDDASCFEHIAQARHYARKAGGNLGVLLVREFEQCLLRGRLDRLKAILREIELHHMQDRQVREFLTSVLARYGLITPDGQMLLPVEATESVKTESGVWTPESASSGASKSGGGLWLPGQ